MQNSSRRTRTVAVVAVALLATAALVLWNQRDADEPEDIPRTTSGTEVDAATRASESSHAAATGTAGEVAHELTERAGADDVTLLVVGDSTGDERTEWVALWAARMAGEGAEVTYRDWVPGEERWTDDPLTLGDGDRHVTIVNASQAGARPAYPLARRLLPDAADLVLVSFGHNGTREQEVAEMRQLLDRLAQDYPDAPVGVIAQNPALGGSVEHSRANREAVEQVARARDLPVIDVHGAFVDHGDVESLLVDDLHPSDAGSRLWAETVHRFLTTPRP
ncbi:SGNH/GDSL hydrolase family protein [Kytococcus sedentarius]|uniref:SGNH/GDSL hydrolase family protein n=1 Tax=Kytococcus sedentarius TaxID=1276 RepID=UPI00019EB52D|nr:SGNH/GDSL hydrolase family protein [Kytococcus sedentarius]QQB63381.1 SGNH/GDSL hydrolase family protein [Kytococcus sedentarius]